MGERRVARDELTWLMETLPAALVRMDRGWVITYVNANAEAIYGRTREQLVGLNVWDAFPEARGTLIEEAYSAAMDTGQAGTLEVFFAPLDTHFDIRIWPDEDGLTLFFHDVNDRQRTQMALDAALAAKDAALAAKDAAARRLAALNAVALELTAAESAQDLERIVLERALAVLGTDGGSLVAADEDGNWRSTISAVLGEHVRSTYAVLPFGSPLPGCWSVRTGQRLILPDRASGLAFDPVMAAVYQDTGRQGWAFLPLVVRGRRLGALSVSWIAEHTVDAEELGVLEGFAAQCAQTLDRIQSAAAQQQAAAAVQRMSETLQRALLTQPTTPGSVQIAVRYHPAASDAQVGGDWYDAFTTKDGATLLVVGDITGHDQVAAAIMGQVRNLLRGMAYDSTDSPAVLLTRLDGAMRGLELGTLATAVLGRLEHSATDRQQGVWRLRWSNAGHPPPLLRRTDATVEVLDGHNDLLLGLDPRASRGERLVELTAGSTLVMYTDGLIERRDAGLGEGIARLAGVLATAGDLDPEALADQLLAAMGTEGNEDDTALLVLRLDDDDAAGDTTR